MHSRQFQSTRLLRSETLYMYITISADSISIHSPLTKRDLYLPMQAHGHQDFNPLASYEARPFSIYFYPSNNSISIHSPLTKRDRIFATAIASHLQFQSTRLLRSETLQIRFPTGRRKFQSTRLLRSETQRKDVYCRI